MRSVFRLGGLIVLAALAGCAARTPLLQGALAPDAPQRVELAATPFFPQERYQCGPAALAAVLGASGITVTPEQLVDLVFIPGRQGSLQTELLGASRLHDRLPYRLEPQLAAIAGQLAAGRPVLVLQNLGFARIPAWHYAVIVGFDASTDSIVLRSGTTERLVLPAHRFMKTWDRGGRWALVLVEPGEFPADPAKERYLEAAAGLEAAGRLDAALKSYDAALARWPGATTALLGVGNVNYRQRNLAEAADAYRRLLEADPGHAVGRNNLAQVLLEQGDAQAALREITTARQQLADPRFAPMLAQTEAGIRRALGEAERR